MKFNSLSENNKNIDLDINNDKSNLTKEILIHTELMKILD